MAVIRSNDKSVKEALRHPDLIGKPFLAKGKFALVFNDTPETVLKLTADDYHWQLLREARNLPPAERVHFPEVVEDFGEVGEIKHKTLGDVPLFLMRITRLQHAVAGSAQSKLIRKLCKDQMTTRSKHVFNHRGGRLSYEILQDMANAPEFSSLSNPMRYIANFAKKKGAFADIDFHFKNFMVGKDDKIVFADPLMNGYTFSQFI